MPGDGLTHGPPATRKAGGSHHRFSRINRHSLRDGFNGFLRALPGDRAFLPPSPARRETRLYGLSLSVGRPGPHDFAVRLSHARPTCHPRPPHPRLAYRDDRPKRPSSSRRDAREHRRDLPDAASANTCGRSARRAICAWGACGGWPSGKTNVRQFGCEETGSKCSPTTPEDRDALEHSAWWDSSTRRLQRHTFEA